MSICKECGGVDVHHTITCSKAPKPAKPPKPVELPPPPPLFKVGEIVVYDWPGEGPVACMVVSAGEGEVGLMVLHANVRVNQEDVEEI